MSNDAISSCSIESEQYLIGLLIYLPDMSLGLIKSILKPTDFYRVIHTEVFRAAIKLSDANITIEPLVVKEELKKYENSEEWQIDEYFSACFARLESADQSLTTYHANKVKQCSAIRQQAQIAIESRSRLAKPDTNPDEVLAWTKAQLAEVGKSASTDLTQIGDDIDAHMDWLGKSASIEGLEGYSTGFSHLDCATGGYGQPIFVIFKGRRKQGKTHHVVAPMFNCLKAGSAVLFASMDTPKRIMYNRLLAHITGINSFRIKRLHTDDEWNRVIAARTWLKKQPLFLSHKSGTTVSMVESKCEAILDKGYKLGLVVIDYAELMGSDEKGLSKEQDLSKMAVGLQNLRDKFETTILLLSQTNKDGGARWSEGIENAVDLILKWEIGEYEKGKGTGSLIIEGNRVGSAGEFQCVFDFGTSRIREVELDMSDRNYPPSMPWWFDDCPFEDLKKVPMQGMVGNEQEPEWWVNN